jgi:hypothetical protein
MQKDDPEPKEVDRFILEEIDSVPHLEALLLLWRNNAKKWSCAYPNCHDPTLPCFRLWVCRANALRRSVARTKLSVRLGKYRRGHEGRLLSRTQNSAMRWAGRPNISLLQLQVAQRSLRYHFWRQPGELSGKYRSEHFVHWP